MKYELTEKWAYVYKLETEKSKFGNIEYYLNPIRYNLCILYGGSRFRIEPYNSITLGILKVKE